MQPLINYIRKDRFQVRYTGEFFRVFDETCPILYAAEFRLEQDAQEFCDHKNQSDDSIETAFKEKSLKLLSGHAGIESGWMQVFITDLLRMKI